MFINPFPEPLMTLVCRVTENLKPIPGDSKQETPWTHHYTLIRDNLKMPLMPLDLRRKSEYLEAQGECLEMQGGGGNQTPNPRVVEQKYYALPTS